MCYSTQNEIATNKLAQQTKEIGDLTWFCGMKLHQVKKIKGAGSRVAGASVDNEHEVAEVVDGTLEQALHFKRTNRQSAKNKVYTLAAKEGKEEARNNTGKAWQC